VQHSYARRLTSAAIPGTEGKEVVGTRPTGAFTFIDDAAPMSVAGDSTTRSIERAMKHRLRFWDVLPLEKKNSKG
jgi:hypothetical protein